MITQQAQSGLNDLFKRAAESSLSYPGLKSSAVSVVNEAEIDAGDECVVFTISAAGFKCLLIFRYLEGRELRNIFLGSDRESDSEEKAFEDVFLEFGNVCSGALNRDLLNYFPDLGMSTPYKLFEKSLDYIPLLEPGHLEHFEIKLNESIGFYVSICLCDFQDIDFTVEKKSSEEETDTGELEFF